MYVQLRRMEIKTRFIYECVEWKGYIMLEDTIKLSNEIIIIFYEVNCMQPVIIES